MSKELDNTASSTVSNLAKRFELLNIPSKSFNFALLYLLISFLILEDNSFTVKSVKFVSYLKLFAKYMYRYVGSINCGVIPIPFLSF